MSRFMLRHCSILSFLLLAGSCLASDLTVSLSGIAARLRSSHPSLQAARLAVDEARGRQLGAGRLANPTVGVEFQNQSAVSPSALTFSIDQSFPLTRRLRLEKKLTAQLVAAAELEVQEAERRLIAEAQGLAVRIIALHGQSALRIEQNVLATKLSEFVKAGAAQGEFSALDAAQAQIDARRLLVEARKYASETVSLLGSLKPMLGLSAGDHLTLVGGLPPLALPQRRADWKQRADYQLAQTKAAAASTGVELAMEHKWQDITAGIFVAREQQDVTPAQTEQTGFAGIRLSIPLPVWNQNQGEIAEKAASAERSRLESEALTQTILSESETARQELLAQADLVREMQDELLPLVIEQAAKLEKAYESGQTDLLTVLRAWEQRLVLETATLDAVRDFHLARIRYEAATGQHAPVAGPLPRTP